MRPWPVMFIDIDVYCIQTAAAHTIMLDLLYRKAATRIHTHVHLDPVPPMCLDESFFFASVASPPMFRRDDERTCPSLASLTSFLHIQPLQDPHMRVCGALRVLAVSAAAPLNPRARVQLELSCRVPSSTCQRDDGGGSLERASSPSSASGMFPCCPWWSTRGLL